MQSPSWDRGRLIECGDKEAFVDRWRRLHLDVLPGAALPPMAGRGRDRHERTPRA